MLKGQALATQVSLGTASNAASMAQPRDMHNACSDTHVDLTAQHSSSQQHMLEMPGTKQQQKIRA